ncbi:MAG: 2Fe-2S iron-sulfur cluster-binding protein [Pseudomonadota bacterium]
MSDAADRFAVLLEPSGRRFDAPAGVPLLRAARAAGLILPSSCRNGTCRACICRLVSGRVRYGVDWPGLSVDEKAEGFILPCVAIPESPLVIDAARVVDIDLAP